MAPRLALHNLLKTLCGNVYFQPPGTDSMVYPCILYERDYMVTKFANDLPYQNTKRYSVTVIDRNPDSEIPDKVAALRLCKFSRHYTADNLHHDVYNLYF